MLKPSRCRVNLDISQYPWDPFLSDGCNPSGFETEGLAAERFETVGSHQFMRKLNSKRIGAIGVSVAALYYTLQGFDVSYPASDTARYDLIVTGDMTIHRIQVKTSTRKAPSGNYRFSLRTSGGNQSWDHQCKPIETTDCELVVLVGIDGSLWEFPVEDIAGMAEKVPQKTDRKAFFELNGEFTG